MSEIIFRTLVDRDFWGLVIAAIAITVAIIYVGAIIYGQRR